MKILGIDPGTRVMGYGVIETDDDDAALVDYGVIIPPEKSDITIRLSHIFRELQSVITRHHPDVIAVEQPFVAKNVKSAMAIGRAQAVALLAAAESGIPAHEYTPARVKQLVADYGAGSKEQVQEMVRLQLGLAEVPQPDDAADALAVAICHCREMHVAGLLSAQEDGR